MVEWVTVAKGRVKMLTFVGHITNVIARVIELRIRRPYGPKPLRAATLARNLKNPMHT